MNHEDNLKRCTEYLQNLVNKVNALNTLNYYDINISCEKFYMYLLNLIYGWNLKNINDEENNAVSIDLYDKEARVAVQVTSDSNANKIRETIKKHIKNNRHNEYDRLVFVVITHNKDYRADFVTEGKFVFDKKRDIITCNKLIDEISHLSPERIAEICEYLSFEFDSIANTDLVWTIEKADEYLRKNTNCKLSLDYFEVDDKDFISNFNTVVEDEECIYVKGTSREETLFCVLNQIKNSNTDKDVYVIKNKEVWLKLERYIQDAIIIPYFQSEEISCVKGNINIFIYGIEDNSVKDYITLRRRKMSTLEKKLKDCGIEEDSFVKKTNGIYPFIKKYLFEGHINAPSWGKDPSRSIIVAILLGQWEEADGDKQIIEKLSGIPYADFVEVIGRYINVENPLFIRITDWGRTFYRLADVAMSWSAYGQAITSQQMDEFLTIVKSVIANKDPLFDLPIKKHYYRPREISEPTYSNTIKKGMLRSLIFLGLNGEQRRVDTCVEEILLNVNDLSMWSYIAQFAGEICEASPSKFLDKIDKSKDNEEFISLFQQGDNSFTARHYYTHILWAMECLLRTREYASRTVHILMYLTTKIQACPISNSPAEVLSVFFCTWTNIYSVSIDDKIKYAEIGIKRYESMWDIIFDRINSSNSSIMVSRSTFDYRLSEDVTEVTYEDMYKQNLMYLKFLREKAFGDVSRWQKLIKLLGDVPNDIFEEMISELEENSKNANDAEKEIIKTKLRTEIYRHRYFCRSEWAMDEPRVARIEEVCKRIRFGNPVYDFLYLYHSEYDLPLYNPHPYDAGMSDENKELRHQLLDEEFKRIKEENIDICDLIKLRPNDDYNCLGGFIAKYYCDGKFDEELYGRMVKISGIQDILIGYMYGVNYKDSDVWRTALSISESYDNDIGLYVRVLMLREPSEEHFEFVCSLSEDMQKRYFSYLHIIGKKRPSWGNILIEKCIEYSCVDTLLNFLYNTKEEYTVDEMIVHLSSVAKIITVVNNTHEQFLIQELVKHVQLLIKGEYYRYDDMIEIEFKFHKILEWDNMMCFQYLFKTNAEIYAQLIECVMKKDEEEVNDPNNYSQENVRALYGLYYNAHFCPGEIEGKIDKDVLTKWLEDFENSLTEHKQKSLFSSLIGRLFAYSPVGNDGYYPHEYIREVIEEKLDTSMSNAYRAAEFNKRGMHIVDAGEGEKTLALRYQENADSIRVEYPKTAEIYDLISKGYFADAKAERERAENGIW